MYNSNRHRTKKSKAGKFIFFLLMGILFLFLIGHVIQFLWNTILVEATGVNPLSYWHSLGLFALSRILFGGFRFGNKARKWKRNKGAEWREKWVNMTEEEKLEMKLKWRARCGKK